MVTQVPLPLPQVRMPGLEQGSSVDRVEQERLGAEAADPPDQSGQGSGERRRAGERGEALLRRDRITADATAPWFGDTGADLPSPDLVGL